MRENEKEGGIYMGVEKDGENKRGRYMERTKERGGGGVERQGEKIGMLRNNKRT